MTPKPDIIKQWQIQQQVIADKRNEVDNFGFIETGATLQDREIEQPIEIEKDLETSGEDNRF